MDGRIMRFATNQKVEAVKAALLAVKTAGSPVFLAIPGDISDVRSDVMCSDLFDAAASFNDDTITLNDGGIIRFMEYPLYSTTVLSYIRMVLRDEVDHNHDIFKSVNIASIEDMFKLFARASMALQDAMKLKTGLSGKALEVEFLSVLEEQYVGVEKNDYVSLTRNVLMLLMTEYPRQLQTVVNGTMGDGHSAHDCAKCVARNFCPESEAVPSNQTVH